MNGTTAYLARELSAASPAKKVAMLLDRAVASLGEAVQAIERRDIQARWNANQRAMQIIEMLLLHLDMEKGGEIAANLDKLYNFMLNRLTQVDIKNDPAPAREVASLLEPLRRSWHELVQREARATPASRPDAAPAGSALDRRLAVSA
ncbi:MAG: flagellar export chaperone FliS [Pseudomonadota bacterium]